MIKIIDSIKGIALIAVLLSLLMSIFTNAGKGMWFESMVSIAALTAIVKLADELRIERGRK